MRSIINDCQANGFVLGRSLGEGGYGQVFQATYANYNCEDDPLAKRLRSLGHGDKVSL